LIATFSIFLRKRLNEIAQAGDLVERLAGVASRVEFGSEGTRE
jgi:hypothetical protein